MYLTPTIKLLVTQASRATLEPTQIPVYLPTEADCLPLTNHKVDLYFQLPLRLHDLQLNKTLGQINL
jgi:hypothetical protein